jgi:glycosyltransferase involved in cell wall biosynthesis
LGLVEHPNHVCCRYRLAAFAPSLRIEGHSLALRSLPASAWQWWQLRDEIAAADVVVLQRRLLSKWHLQLLRRYSRTLVFDFDDAVFQRDSYHRKGAQSGRRQRRFENTIRTADFVIAGNDYLTSVAARYKSANAIATIPTCVDVEKYPVAAHAQTDRTNLVWIGSASTLKGLVAISPLLDALPNACANVRLLLIADQALMCERLPIVFRPWSEETEARDLASAAIGISWIPADTWSRGKCGLKVLQYMAAGLPVIANPVGVHRELVVEGETGYLARDTDEWSSALALLAKDRGLRLRMGCAARAMVEARYSVRFGARQWRAVLESISQREQAA